MINNNRRRVFNKLNENIENHGIKGPVGKLQE